MNTSVAENHVDKPHTPAYDLREFRTTDQLVEEYPNLISENALRWALRFRHENGLDRHVTKFGKILLIHVPGFTSWLMLRDV